MIGGQLMAATVIISAAGQHRWAERWHDRRPSAFSLGTAFREIRESLTHPAFLVLLAAGAIAYTSQGISLRSRCRMSSIALLLRSLPGAESRLGGLSSPQLVKAVLSPLDKGLPLHAAFAKSA